MAIDWSELYKMYKGRWVALKEDEQTVIASGVTAAEAVIKAQKLGYEKPILTKVPDRLIAYVGSGL